MWIERAHQDTEGLYRTVDALRQLARVGRQPLSAEPVDLNAVVNDTADDLRTQLDEADAHLEVQRLPTVEADRSQRRLVFQNLIANALKFRQPQRRLTMPVTATEHAEPRDPGARFIFALPRNSHYTEHA